MMEAMNPVREVQGEIASLLASEPWFKAHGVEIVEQDKQDLAFLIKKAMASVAHVCLVVGVDRITNDHPAMECTVTVTATEHVLANRAKQGFVSAIDAALAAIQMLDGERWHFDELEHTSQEQTDVLQATVRFRGLVSRDFIGGTLEFRSLADENGGVAANGFNQGQTNQNVGA
jgi:hypothetical protein